MYSVVQYNSFLCISEHPHELHKNYLLAPERLQIEENILSDYQHHLLQVKDSANLPASSSRIYATKRTTSSTTAIQSCTWNWSYVSSTSIVFDQLSWLKNYINFNIRQLTAAKNDFEKDFFKLMKNAVFGKSFHSLCLFVLLCSYVFIHSFIDSFIVRKTMETSRN